MRKLLLASLLALGYGANAQYHIFTEYDINPGSISSNPKNLTLMNGQLYFTATTAATGSELFSINGLLSTFNLVSDIRPGPMGADISNFTMLGSSQLIFTADDGNTGIEVWQSDGTSSGTSLLKDVFAGGVSSTPANFKYYNGKVYFGAFGSGGGELDLWATDGTTAGTQLLKNINPTGSSYPEDFCESNGKLYFSAYTDLQGTELWVTDGTDTGTKMVKDIVSGIMSGFPYNKIAVGNKILFEACCAPPPFAVAVYESDGSAAGTKYFIKAGFNKLNKNFIIPWKNKMYLDVGSTWGGMLWVTDGTIAGTDTLGQIGIAGWPVVLNDKLYFSGSKQGTGIELMVSDGTISGTKVLADILMGPDGSAPSHLAVYKDKIYFAAASSLGDTQLYVSDGTDTGTHKIVNPLGTQINPLSASAFNGFKELDGKLYFAANYTGNGAEMWSIEETLMSIDVEQIVKSNSVNLSPNPAKGICNIEMQNTEYRKGDIQLYDMKGSLIQKQQLSSGQRQASLLLNNITPGVYTVRIELDCIVVNRKLVVQ